MLWVSKTRGRNTENFPNNVSCQYVCLHGGCFIALNISDGSCIKHSLYFRLPSILPVYFSKSKFRSKQQHAQCFDSILFMNKHANLLAYGLTFCVHVTVAHDSYHTSYMILYLHWSQTLNTRREKPKTQREKHNTRKTIWKSSCSIFTMGVNCKQTFFWRVPSVGLWLHRWITQQSTLQALFRYNRSA